jgi:hypothetical protein
MMFPPRRLNISLFSMVFHIHGHHWPYYGERWVGSRAESIALFTPENTLPILKYVIDWFLYSLRHNDCTIQAMNIDPAPPEVKFACVDRI